jgi:teichoic acid transport system permease protein
VIHAVPSDTVTDVQPMPAAATMGLDSAALAERFGMTRAGARPPLPAYVRDLWSRRHFIVNYTSAANQVAYSNSFLGQVWQVLTPLLNAGVYYLIFGLLLRTSRGTHNFIAFLVIGIFVFTFMQHSIINGSRAVTNNLGIIRALYFPRATLPLGTTAIAFQQLLVSMVVMLPIVLLTGERPAWRWLTILPVLLLESLFALGMAFFVARIGARIPDTTSLLPFIIRTWLYFSGVFYNIEVFTKHHGHWLKIALDVNPGATFIELARGALLAGHPTYAYEWLAAVLWAVIGCGAGLVYFWMGEEEYGRV